MTRQEPSTRPDLRSAVLRFVLMVAMLVAAYFLFRQTELVDRLSLDRLAAAVDSVRDRWWSPLALIGLWALLSPLGAPATPFLLAGGVVFGPWWGTLYNLVGAVLGASGSYVFARHFGHDLVAHLFGEERMRRLERQIEHYGFWSLASLRLIPFPWQVINFGAALAGIKPGPFVASTLIGMVPMVFVFTVFYASLGSMTTGGGEAVGWLLAALGLMVLLALARLVLRRRTPLDD